MTTATKDKQKDKVSKGRAYRRSNRDIIDTKRRLKYAADKVMKTTGNNNASFQKASDIVASSSSSTTSHYSNNTKPSSSAFVAAPSTVAVAGADQGTSSAQGFVPPPFGAGSNGSVPAIIIPPSGDVGGDAQATDHQGGARGHFGAGAVGGAQGCPLTANRRSSGIALPFRAPLSNISAASASAYERVLNALLVESPIQFAEATKRTNDNMMEGFRMFLEAQSTVQRTNVEGFRMFLEAQSAVQRTNVAYYTNRDKICADLLSRCSPAQPTGQVKNEDPMHGDADPMHAADDG